MEQQSKFILLVVFEIPAVVLSIIIFVYFAYNRAFCLQLKNHGWIVLLTKNFLQLIFHLPMPMNYYRLNYIWPRTNAYCTWWTWCEYSMNITGLTLMAWISVERHLFIFHAHTLFRVRWKKWMFHYIPLAFCLMWTPLFYFFLVVISPFCTNVWNFNRVLCGFPCYYNIGVVLMKFDFTFDILFPVVTITLANVTLVLRVIHQQMYQQRPVEWRRHRKMVLQLWIVSSLYIGLWVPLAITLIVQQAGQRSFMVNETETMQFGVYFVPLFLPMICLSTQPELLRKMQNIIRRRPMNRICGVTYNRNTEQTPNNPTA